MLLKALSESSRSAGKKMEKTGSPKKLWDHLLELEALIRSNTAHHIYQLKGEVPETVVSEETSDISLFMNWNGTSGSSTETIQFHIHKTSSS